MSNFENHLAGQRSFFAKTITKSVTFRITHLKKLKTTIKNNEQAILNALKKDLNKSEFESYAAEVGFVLSEIDYTIKNLPKWVKPKKVRTPITHFYSTSTIHPEPYGVVLIMSPWNYPFQLTMVPLISAIAAGNTAVVKPSRFTPNVYEIIQRIISEIFNENYVKVIASDEISSEHLLDYKFDYIFFTGSTRVGKIVMGKAAEHLTPLTLELGGKSPCIVDRTANLKLAARQIIWGKTLNAGQTCVAPDYILVDEMVKDLLIDCMKKEIVSLWGENPNSNNEYVRIINEKHFNRLIGLMNNEAIVFGGKSDSSSLHIEPTILENVELNSPIMQEEIFGPILPVISFKVIDDAFQIILNRSKPLALYGFTTDKTIKKRIIQELSFGGGCINETLMHLATPYMPFGGIGDSGFGSCHGKFGFDTFTHYKSVLQKSNAFDIPLRYAPYKNKLSILKKLF
ncbi:MAG: NAD-dependent aldehyde dehydrogenase [Bacillales bacterium]|jgi:aldehyde dehydrogenase (NAD+)|nr:NAD-dependent aldehyde dehydrogenase [Bacillales bacterium]